jgi:hypothetical protein
MKGSGITIKPPTADSSSDVSPTDMAIASTARASSSSPERAKINFRVGCGCRIEQQGDTVDARRNLLEPLQPLAGYRALDISKTCSVAARPRQARNKPLATGSATVPKMMGIVRGCCRSASVVDVVDERTTSGCDATSC